MVLQKWLRAKELAIRPLLAQLQESKWIILIAFTVGFFALAPNDFSVTISFGSDDSKVITEDTQLGFLPIPVITVSAKPMVKDKVKTEPKMSDYEIAMWLLKSYESLRLESYWDVKQWSVGWGTKSKKGEVISKEEADKRTRDEFARVYKDLEKRYPKLDRWNRLILAVTDYNVGKFGTQLEEAILQGDSTKIAKVVRKYYHDANGNKLEGLVKRRNHEAKLLLASDHEKQEIGKQLREKVIQHINKAKLK